MKFSLGIDAGGTYTDAVLVRDMDGSIVATSKALTTYPDLIRGIRDAIDGLRAENLDKVSLVSVSTTLATNTVLEGTGSPVALILVGDHPTKGTYPAKHYTVVSGGHTFDGEETISLDIAAVRDFALRVKGSVSAFAVSSFFSIRNPEHELAIRNIVNDATGLPVVCGHELSQDLGAYERAVTATLNAQLLPICRNFISSMISEIKRREMNARLIMLKCDGTVIGINEALKKPIESIFSGPAASLVGASYLCGLETCAVVDVGGTSTDVSSIVKGVPELTDTGAVVGGWKTRVRATRMETSALGGDSQVWVKGKHIFIGPRRVIPLCLAAERYPMFIEKLKKCLIPPRSSLDMNIQPARMYVRTGFDPIELDEFETEVLAAIGNEPLTLEEIASSSRRYPSSIILDSLISKRLIQPIGFTPTDALHILGEYTRWNVKGSLIGASQLSRLNKMDAAGFALAVKEKMAHSIAFDLMAFLLKGVERKGIEQIVNGYFPTRFKLDMPVVLIGGPVTSFKDELSKIIDADIHVPEHAAVGNAVGALFGKGIKRVEIFIRPFSVSEPDRNYLVFSPLGRHKVETYTEALNYAKTLGIKIANEYMNDCGVSKHNMEIEFSQQSFSPEDWKHSPLETRIIMMAVGYPKKQNN
ncbi:hydantoinase/oxoprolinase family protein [uncultured Methanomethylovorans sp.]|uniref:hydantoinase/oxoprolinase family protein n=1 Tax=uncultured Methanomethylovorans sp. TaxID=183759 RepID=UPI002AA899C6|nr:hydantoinase/oxoprolinase family protein [uncultured Methanomethylovorans sp.]